MNSCPFLDAGTGGQFQPTAGAMKENRFVAELDQSDVERS
jgi:hypothetical protein